MGAATSDLFALAGVTAAPLNSHTLLQFFSSVLPSAHAHNGSAWLALPVLRAVCCYPVHLPRLLPHPLPLPSCQVTASQKRLQNKYELAQSTADDWYRRAELALGKGDEELAREALTRRKAFQVSRVHPACAMTPPAHGLGRGLVTMLKG